MESSLKSFIIKIIKKCFGISDLSLWIRKRKQNFEKMFFHDKYTAQDILDVMVSQGLKAGDCIMVHCAMNNFYNYTGTAKELIDKIIEYIGEEGTLCMPSYPPVKEDPEVPFDVRNDRTAAGYLAETFRHYPGVKRSMNKLHSVCALGKHAEFLISEHQFSKVCFDEKSPYYKLALVGGKSFSLGLPKYYIGTIEHVTEGLLYTEIKYFNDKFTTPLTFKYINYEGKTESHVMLAKAKQPYVRTHSTKLVDENFAPEYYDRVRLSNIWINMFDANYCVNHLTELARKGKTIYKSPKFY